MINTVKTSFFLLVVIVLSACTDSRKLETIRQAEMLMQEQPDSALRVLQTVDRHSLRGETLACYALIYSIAQDKSGLDVTNDSLLRIAHEYYSQHPDDSLYARSQYYMGKYLWLTAQTDSAYSCLIKAKAASEEEKDYYTAYLATDRMRRIAEVSDTALCLALSKEAYELYRKHGAINPVNEAYLLNGIGDTYSRRGDGDSAIHYYNIALDKAILSSDSLVIASVYQNMSRHYCYNGQYEIALKYVQRAFGYTGYIDESLAILMAECYLENSEYDKAQQYLNALSSSNSKENKLVRLGLLHRFSAKTGDADAAQEYYASSINVAADMYLNTQKEKLELQRRKLHEEMERQRAESRWKLSATCLVFSLLLLTLIVWLFIKYHRAKKVEHERHLLERNFASKQHERELAYRDSQISLMRKLILERYLFRNNIEKQKQSGKHITITDEDWEEITAFLNATSDNFVTRLKEAYPNLRKKECQFCMLVRLGFSQKDLANIYGIAEVSVKQKMVYYRKWFDISEGLSFKQFITQF